MRSRWGAFGYLTLVGLVITAAFGALNPLDLVVVDNAWLRPLLVLVTPMAVACAIFGGFAAGRPRNLALRVLLGSASVLATLLGIGMAAIMAVFGSGRSLRTEQLWSGDDVTLVSRTFQTGLGPDAACTQLEFRWGNGILQRGRPVGKCLRTEYMSYSAEGDVLHIRRNTLIDEPTDCSLQLSPGDPRTFAVAGSEDGCRELGYS